MNRWELKQRLAGAGVPESNYFIVGIDSQQTPGKGGGFGELVVAPAADQQGWRLMVEERGILQRNTWYASEDEACDAAWAELDPASKPAVRERTPQQRADALARARAAEAEYEQLEQQYRNESG